MAKSIKGTKTEKNLLAAFAGESQARNRYTFLPVPQKKKALNRFHVFSWKPLKMKKNMLKFF